MALRGYDMYLRDGYIYCSYDATEAEYPLIKALPKVPTLEEAQEILSTSVTDYRVSRRYYLSGLKVAPKIPNGVTAIDSWFAYSGLINPPVIPPSIVNLHDAFYYSPALKTPPSIPKNVDNIDLFLAGCLSVVGEMVVRPDSITSHRAPFPESAPSDIILYGDKDVCQSIIYGRRTHWEPWYDPVPAVTDRGQGSYTTAEDMTRMVRNGVLAVDSYAPGRMVYHQGDIVRGDEWEALVEAAQTIDPTVTMSTHYTNLNKIEKAFDDAL